MRLPRFVFIAATAAILIGSGVSLLSCASQASQGPKPDTQAVTSSLDSIDKSAESIDDKTGGAVKEDTNSIRGETKSIRKENKASEAQNKYIVQLQHELRQAEDENKRIVWWAIAGAYGLGILAIAIGFFLSLRSLILGGVGAILGAAVASFVFAWAWVVGLVAMGGAVVYLIFALRKNLNTHEEALSEVVRTTETVKGALSRAENGEAAVAKLFSDENSVANQIQTEPTKALVAQLRGKGATDGK